MENRDYLKNPEWIRDMYWLKKVSGVLGDTIQSIRVNAKELSAICGGER